MTLEGLPHHSVYSEVVFYVLVVLFYTKPSEHFTFPKSKGFVLFWDLFVLKHPVIGTWSCVSRSGVVLPI